MCFAFDTAFSLLVEVHSHSTGFRINRIGLRSGLHSKSLYISTWWLGYVLSVIIVLPLQLSNRPAGFVPNRWNLELVMITSILSRALVPAVKDSATARYCHHHASPWEWCSSGEKSCFWTKQQSDQQLASAVRYYLYISGYLTIPHLQDRGVYTSLCFLSNMIRWDYFILLNFKREQKERLVRGWVFGALRTEVISGTNSSHELSPTLSVTING